MYTLIGQQSVKKSPYITNYIVIDEKDEIVAATIAHHIYFIVMIAILTKKLQPLDYIIKTQRHLTREHVATYKKLGIGHVTKDIVSLWSNLANSLANLENKQQWSEKDCAEICIKWTSFWREYEERASMLMLLPWQTVSKNNVYHNLYNYILLEAQEIAAIFKIEKL